MRKGIFKYACTSIISSLLTGVIFYFVTKNHKQEDSTVINKKLNKFKQYYNMTNQWLRLKSSNKTIAEYLNEQGFKTVAIYGMGELGNRLYEDLMNTDIKVKYAIDKYPENNYNDLEFYELSEHLKEVDIIIVTPVFDFEEITANIESCVDYPIISLEELLFEI